MLGPQFPVYLRNFALPLSLLSGGVASAHMADDIQESGFARVKISFRSRSWKDDPALSLIAAPAQAGYAPTSSDQLPSAPGFEIDGY